MIADRLLFAAAFAPAAPAAGICGVTACLVTLK